MRPTDPSSLQLLDSFTIASVMVLSFVFLRVRFKLINFVGVVLSLIGILSMVMADYSTPCSKAKGLCRTPNRLINISLNELFMKLACRCVVYALYWYT